MQLVVVKESIISACYANAGGLRSKCYEGYVCCYVVLRSKIICWIIKLIGRRRIIDLRKSQFAFNCVGLEIVKDAVIHEIQFNLHRVNKVM